MGAFDCVREIFSFANTNIEKLRQVNVGPPGGWTVVVWGLGNGDYMASVKDPLPMFRHFPVLGVLGEWEDSTSHY